MVSLMAFFETGGSDAREYATYSQGHDDGADHASAEVALLVRRGIVFRHFASGSGFWMVKKMRDGWCFVKDKRATLMS